jgi:tetratricopeptide (TPR) repeat protein
MVREGNRSEAARLVEEGRTVVGEHATFDVLRALDVLAGGQTREAAEILTAAARAYPEAAQPLYHLAFVRLEQGRPEAAAEAFRESLERSPGSARTHAELARVETARGRWAEAASHLRQAVGLDPRRVEYLNDYAWLLATGPPEVRKRAESLNWARRASRLAGGTDPRVLDTLAAALAVNGRFDEAVAAAQGALRHLPADAAERNLYRQRLESYREKRPWTTDPGTQAPIPTTGAGPSRR